MTFDFTKGLSFIELEELGIKKQDSVKLLMVLMPVIKMEFEEKVEKVVGKEKMKEIRAKAVKDKLSAEKELEIIENIYFKETKNYFMEEMRLISNKMLDKLAKVIKVIKGQMNKYGQLSKEDKKKLEKLMDGQEWEEVLKLINKDLKEKEGE